MGLCELNASLVYIARSRPLGYVEKHNLNTATKENYKEKEEAVGFRLWNV